MRSLVFLFFLGFLFKRLIYASTSQVPDGRGAHQLASIVDIVPVRRSALFRRWGSRFPLNFASFRRSRRLASSRSLSRVYVVPSQLPCNVILAFIVAVLSFLCPRLTPAPRRFRDLIDIRHAIEPLLLPSAILPFLTPSSPRPLQVLTYSAALSDGHDAPKYRQAGGGGRRTEFDLATERGSRPVPRSSTRCVWEEFDGYTNI